MAVLIQPYRDGKSLVGGHLARDESPRYLLAPEAARGARVHYLTLVGWIKDGQVPAHKFQGRRRILRQDLDALLAGRS